MGIVFKNNAKTTLSSNISNSATSIAVTDGSVFPSLNAGEFFLCTFDDGTYNEIVKCTARSSNTLTVIRAQESTTARAFVSTDACEGRVTAGVLETIQENIAAKSANQTVYNATTASSATAYNVGTDPQEESNAMVFLNGVMQHHDTFSFSGSTLTFDAAPSNGLKLEVIIDNLINLQSSNLTVDSFTATSGQTAFTLTDVPAAEDNLIVFIEGVFQNQDAYSFSGTTLTMSAGVTLNRKVVVYIINPVNIGTPSDGTVTSAKLSGNITTPGNLTVGAYDVSFDSPTFVVDNANSRVGIGTSTPQILLDITGDTQHTGHVLIRAQNELRFYEAANYIGFEAPALSANQIWVLPAADGSANQMLKTDGSGNLGWRTDVEGTITSVGNMSDNRVITASGATTLNGEANLTFDGSTLAVTGAQTISTTLAVTGVATFTAVPVLPANTIDSAHYVDGSIDLAHMSVNSIDSDQYVDGSIDAAHLAAAQTNITSLGTLTTLTVDDITINGSTISDGGVLTVDVAGAIILDADDDGEVRLKDGGTQYATLKKASNNLKIQAIISDGDITFAGNDGGSTITALTLDMSQAGYAIFNSGVSLGGETKLGDNSKLILGAGDDLQLYHDGSNSYIKDTGTGSLVISSGGLFIQNAAADENMIRAVENGAVTLYYDNAAKLDTVTGGINVTGTVVCDGGNFDGAATFNDTGADADFRVESENNANMFFIDAANDRVGIGTASPDYILTVAGENSITTTVAEGAEERFIFTPGGSGNNAILHMYNNAEAEKIQLNTGGDSYFNGGNIGIGTASPEANLEIKNTNATIAAPHIAIEGSGGASDDFSIYAPAGENTLRFAYQATVNADLFTIKSDGANGPKIGIGTTAPDSELQINTATTQGIINSSDVGIHLQSSNGGGSIYGQDMNHSILFRKGRDGSGDVLDFHEYGQMRFYTNGLIENQDEAMRIDSSGRVLVHKINFGYVAHGSALRTDASFIYGGVSGSNLNYWSDEGSYWYQYSAGWQQRMHLNDAGTLTAVAYSTSDIALKENITDITGGLSLVKQLRPVNFDWKESAKGTGVAGFIAQEVETILPNEVQGDDWEATVVDEENLENTIPGSIGKGLSVIGIVAHLTKAVQELEARLATLEG